MRADNSFIGRLTDEQIADFFSSHGVEFGRIEKHEQDYNRLSIVLFQSNESSLHYVISDSGIIDCNIDGTKEFSSEEWKIFMRSIFGYKYIMFLGYEDFLNDFIDKLTIDDVKKIFNFNSPIQIESIYEVDALLKGTRRFKIIPSNTKSGNKIEFILKPYMTYGFEYFSPKSPEGKFLKFMTKKFGSAYIEYYSQVEQHMVKRDIQNYVRKRKNRMQETTDYMRRIALKEHQ